MIVAFTGHRPDKLGGYGRSAVQSAVRRAIFMALALRFHETFGADQELTGCISGMALGVDQWAAEICSRRCFPTPDGNSIRSIPWVAAVPFEGQESRWPKAAQDRYWQLLHEAQATFVLAPKPDSTYKVGQLMQARNAWMVDHCDAVLAVWDGSPGGTSNCLEYARRKGKQIRIIDPRNLKVNP